MISTWKNTFLPGKSYCICRTQNAIYIATHTATHTATDTATHTATHTATTATHTATHTAVLLLIPLLILRERGLTLRADHQRIRQPLCWGGIGRIRIRAGLSGGGRLATSWRGLALFIGCIAAPCLSPVLQVGRWL